MEIKVSTKFNSQLPARPESIAAVLKVLSQNDELMVKDIARLGRLTQSQARRALEELVGSGQAVAPGVAPSPLSSTSGNRSIQGYAFNAYPERA
jgi:hypothetical protein